MFRVLQLVYSENEIGTHVDLLQSWPSFCCSSLEVKLHGSGCAESFLKGSDLEGHLLASQLRTLVLALRGCLQSLGLLQAFAKGMFGLSHPSIL